MFAIIFSLFSSVRQGFRISNITSDPERIYR